MLEKGQRAWKAAQQIASTIRTRSAESHPQDEWCNSKTFLDDQRAGLENFLSDHLECLRLSRADQHRSNNPVGTRFFPAC